MYDEKQSGVSNAASSGLADAKQGALHAVDGAKEAIAGARKAGSELTGSVKDLMDRHPIVCVGGAMGVGLLLGLVFCRSKN